MSSFRIFNGTNNAKRMRMDRSIVGNDIPYLAEEIISEILSYSDVKSLLVCKSVCKVWYAIIKDPEFVKMHMTRNNDRFHVFKCNGESSDGTLETYQYLSSINGLLLEERKSSTTPGARYRIGNPSTKEILDIPHPNTIGYYLLGVTIYLDSGTGLYYLASISCDGNCNSFVFKVLELGCPCTYLCNCEFLSWRTLNIKEMKNLNELERYGFTIITSPVGMLYVLKTFKVGLGKPEIICIDLVQETCTTCIAPDSILHNRKRVKFQLWQEKPTILYLVKDKLSVWVLEDYKKKKWSDKISISLTYLNDYPRLKRATPVFFHADGQDMLIYNFPSACYVYKLKSKEFHTVAPGTGKNIEVAETLVSLRGMRVMRPERS